jgi:hypothetical protein
MGNGSFPYLVIRYKHYSGDFGNLRDKVIYSKLVFPIY